MSLITMIGTCHCDVDGPGKLECSLAELQPNIVLVEGSNKQAAGYELMSDLFAAKLRQMKVPQAKITAWLDAINRYNGFEWKSCSAYCAAQRVKFADFDDYAGFTPASIEKSVRTLLTSFARWESSGRGAEGYLDAWREEARDVYSTLKYFGTTPGDEATVAAACRRYYDDAPKPRDEQMATVLRQLVTENPGAHIATVTGYWHVLHDPKRLSLYSRVLDLQPRRRIMDGAIVVPDGIS